MALSEFKNESLFKQDGTISEIEARRSVAWGLRHGLIRPAKEQLHKTRPPSHKKEMNGQTSAAPLHWSDHRNQSQFNREHFLVASTEAPV